MATDTSTAVAEAADKAAANQDTDQLTYSDPESGASYPIKVPKEPATEKIPVTKEREEMLKRPYVAPTGGEPTPIEHEAGAAPAEGPLPYSVPSWSEISGSDEFKAADSDTQLKMLDAWTEDARKEARQVALKNNEDPNVYDKGIDNIYAQTRKTLENPYEVISQTGLAATKGAVRKGAEIAAGAVSPLAPLVRIDDIKDLSIDQAKHERDLLSMRQPIDEDRATSARAFLKKPDVTPQDVSEARVNLSTLEQENLLYHNVPQSALDAQRQYVDTLTRSLGGAFESDHQATNAIKIADGNRFRLDALNKYIDSGGTELPALTGTQKAAEAVQQWPENVDRELKINQVYQKEHPKLNGFAQGAGALLPYIAAGAVTGGTGWGAAATQAVMGYADAFQTGYESAQEKLNERERNGEYFSPAERETLALDDASESAFGVGTFQAASNIILGSAFAGNIHLNPETKVLAGENLKNFLLHAGKEVTSQSAIQAGSQVASNIASAASGVSPDTPWYQGVPEAAGEGALYGGAGTGIRVLSSLGQRRGEQLRLDSMADTVRSNAQNIVQNDPNTPNDQALEHALNEGVPPEDRDAVRTRILNQDAAKDQRQTADKLRDAGSPSTADEMDKTAAASENTATTPAGSQADRIAERQRRMREAQAAKEAEAAKTPPGEEKKPAPTGEEVKAPPTAEVPQPTPEDSAARDERRNGIIAKLDQLTGGDDAVKKGIVNTYLGTHIYGDPNVESLQKTTAAKVLHELGIKPQSAAWKSWAKSTPEVTRMMEDHLSDHLDTLLAEKQAKEEAAAKAAVTPITPAPGVPPPTPAVTPPEGAPPPEGMAMPPGMLEDAIKNDDPSKLLTGLRGGRQQTVTLEQSEDPKYDEFFYKHGLDLDEDKANPGNFFLRELHPPEKIAAEQAAIEKEAEEVAAKGVAAAKAKDIAEGKKAAVAPLGPEFQLSKNKDAYKEKTDALPAHPQEEAILNKVRNWLFSPEGEGFLKHKLDPEGAGRNLEYLEELRDAALESYRRSLRANPGGRALTPETAETKTEVTPEETKEIAEGAEEEKPAKAPKIKYHIDLMSRELNSTLGAAGRKAFREGEVRLQAPLGEEGGKAKEEVVAAPGQEAAEAEAKPTAEEEIAKGAPELTGAVEQERKEFAKRFSVGLDPIQKSAEDFEKTLDPKDKRLIWYVLTSEKHYNLPKETPDTAGIKIPEGTKSFKGITDADARRIDALFHTWIKEHLGPAPAVEETAAHGLEPGHPAPGEAGYHAPPGQPGVTPAPHAESVLREPAGERGKPGEPGEETGGYQSGIPQGSKTPPGQPSELLHPPGGGEPGAGAGGGGGITPAAGGGTETVEPAAEAGAGGAAGPERPRGPSAASRERTIVVNEKTPENTGGPNPTPGRKPGVGGAAGVTEAPIIEAQGTTTSQKVNSLALQIAERSIKNPEEAKANGFDVQAAFGGEIPTREAGYSGRDVRYADQDLADHLLGSFLKGLEPEQKLERLTQWANNLNQKTAPPAAVPRGATIARALLKDPDVAEDHGIDLEEHNTPEKLLEHLHDLAEHEEDPDEWYREIAQDLGLIKPEGVAPKPTAEAVQTEIQQKIVDAYRQISTETGRESVPNAEVIRRAGVNTADGKNAIKSLGAKVQLDTGDWSTATKAHREASVLQDGKPRLYMRVLEEAQPENIAKAAGQSVAEKIAQHLNKNPELAQRFGLEGVTSPDDLTLAVGRMGANTPEEIERTLTQIAQKLGVVDPPHPPGGTKGSGTLHSLVPGIAGIHHFDGQVNDLVGRFRASPDPEMQAFAISLNANKDRLVGMPARQLNFAAPAVFYQDGEIFVSPAAVNHPLGEHAMAHEIQHAIAQRIIASPKTAQDFDHVAHWEHLRDQLRQSLPADLRDGLEDLGPAFDRWESDPGEELDTRYMTHAQRNWLPVLYAAYKGENMMHAAFSNPVFRDYLNSVRMGDGRTLLQGVEHWGRTVFGPQAFRFADRATPLVKLRPGIPVKFDPKVFDLKNAYPLTDSEKHLNLMVQQYNLRNGVQAMLKAVHEISSNPRHSVIAKALLEAVEAHPEIRTGLEDRLGGIAGGYDFTGDRVTVNPHMDHEAIESSVIHEVTHALTLGKIDAYEKGLMHLLSASDAHAITELEQIREKALNSKGVPEIVRQIAGMETYGQREKAWLKLGQDDPALANKFYGLLDTREFASEVMSNGELQDHLKGVSWKAEGERPQTMLQKVFSWVRKFLGFPDNTALAHAFEAVGELSGGRRVMEADIRTGEFQSDRTMPMQENLLAKRYLENRAQAEGFTQGARQVPPEQLNAWLREFRDQRGISSGEDPYKPTTIAKPEMRGQIRSSQQLDAMTDPRDIIDHLAKVTGTSRFDTDSLRTIADKAFRDRALNLQQYVDTHAGLNELEHQTFNKIHFEVGPGKKEDPYSIISRVIRGLSHLQFSGPFPEEMAAMIRKYTKYEPQAAALEIRNRATALDRAVAKAYKGGKITKKMIDDMNRTVLQGGPAPPSMPIEVQNALADMRETIDRYSEQIAMYQGKDAAAKITENIGKYTARFYRFFDDPRYIERPESQQYRAAAETEMDAMIKGKARGAEARRYALNAKADAERKFAPGSTAAKTAGKTAYDAAMAYAKNNIGKIAVDRKLAEWRQIIDNKATKNLQFGHAYGINEALLEQLKKLPPSLRQMIGEETDPNAIFAKTVWRQQAYLNAVQLSRGLSELGARSGIFSDRLDTARGLTHEIPSGFEHLGDLAGKYTTRDIAMGLTNYAKGLAQLDEGPFWKVIRNLEGRARYTNTILSAARSFGNMWSMFFQHLNNGYNPFTPFNPFNKGNQDIFLGQLMRMNNPQREAYMMKGYRLGLSDKESNINVVMDFLDHGPHIVHERTPMDFMESLSNWYNRGKELPGVKRTGELATDLHTVWNYISKMSQFEQQKIKERAFNDWDVKNVKGAKRLTDEQIEERAAEIVRRTNVSYSMTSPIIARMRRNPVLGTFLTFWESAIHSYVASGIEAGRNMRSANPLRQRDGWLRMGGMLTSMALPLFAQKLSQQLYGVNDKEDENFRKMLPPWEKNNAIIYGPLDGTKRTYTNGLYTSQQSDVWRAMHALLSPNAHGVIGNMTDAGWELFRPSLSLGLIPGAGVNVLRNQTEYGTQVYNPNDHWYNIAGDVTKQIMQREFGGTVGRLSSKLVPGLRPEGKVTPGGLVYNSWTTLLPETGISIKELSFPERFNSELYSTKDSIDQAQRLFTGPIQRSMTELTDNDMSGLYQRSEDARRSVFHELHQKVQAARFGGMNTNAIRSALQQRRYSSQEIDDIMTGQYHPYIPSQAVLDNARKNGNLVPPHLFSKHGVALEPEEEE